MSAPINKTTIDGFKNGELAAFKEIYEQTKEFAYNIIYKMVLNEEEARDLMQDIYTKVFENRTKYDENASAFQTWLYRIAINHTLNYTKRKKIGNAKEIYYESKISTEDEVAEKIIDEEDIILIKKLLLKIQPDYRICLVLCDIDNLSYENIAKKLGINVGTVRSRINRGRKELVQLYKKEVRIYELQKK